MKENSEVLVEFIFKTCQSILNDCNGLIKLTILSMASVGKSLRVSLSEAGWI
eukprot:SAG22_NODE_816_length_7028_cov_32.309280_6_plen_52_part_00